MKHLTNKQKYDLIKEACYDTIHDKPYYQMIGIQNFGLLHDIADALGMLGNYGSNLRNLSHRINNIMRSLIKDGYPIKEYRIKCCSWREKETWHPCFEIKEDINNA